VIRHGFNALPDGLHSSISVLQSAPCQNELQVQIPLTLLQETVFVVLHAQLLAQLVPNVPVGQTGWEIGNLFGGVR